MYEGLKIVCILDWSILIHYFEMGTIWVQIATIYLAGITGIWKGIPVGFALQAPPLITGFFTALGSITAVVILLLSGERFKSWVMRRYGKARMDKQGGRFYRLMQRYGVVGLGLIASGVIGPILSTLLGVALIEKTRRLMIFLIAGVILWSGLITLMAAMGIELITNLIS